MKNIELQRKAIGDATSAGYAIVHLADILSIYSESDDLERLETCHVLAIQEAIKQLGYELAYGRLADISAEMDKDMLAAVRPAIT